MSEIKNNKEPFHNNEKQKIKAVRFADYFIFAILLCLLTLIIFFFSKANIDHDSVDYYTILQKLTDNSKKPVVDNPFFVEQRSPGYSIISILPYYFTSLVIEPFVKTEKIIDERQVPPRPPRPPRPENNGGYNINRAPPGGGSEMMGFPSLPLLAKDIFFKNFYIEEEGGWFEWKIIFALLLTSYIFLFAGIIFSVKTLALRSKEIVGFSLPMLVIFTSPIFMHNIINTPAFATLTAFGLSSLFCFFYVVGFDKKSFMPQFLTGLFLGLLVLTRLETVLIAGVLCIFLVFYKKWGFLKNVILGGSLSLVIFLLYNFSQFGNPLHFGILKGDINQIGFDLNYVFASLLNPKAGILFWSFLSSLGIIGLFLGNKKYLKVLGAASLVLIALFLVRIPVMYKCIGGDPIDIGGMLMPCFRTMEEALMLVRSDTNRYITVLSPFAILGLQNLFIIFGKYFKIKFSAKPSNARSSAKSGKEIEIW